MRSASLLAVAVLALTILASCSILAQASPAIIYSDSQDGYVTTWGGGTASSAGSWAVIGDNAGNDIYRAFFKFSLSGISSTLCVLSARLYIYVGNSYGDDLGDTAPVGLGDAVVRHIGDYGTLDYFNDFNAPSIDNDPGTLIPDGTPYFEDYVSIDVTSAMQDDIGNGRAFTSFKVRHSIDTDNDGDQDGWQFTASEVSGTSQDPYIDYTLGTCPVVGGVVQPVNTFALVAPWLAVIGLVGCGAIVVVAAKKRHL